MLFALLLGDHDGYAVLVFLGYEEVEQLCSEFSIRAYFGARLSLGDWRFNGDMEPSPAHNQETAGCR